MRNFVNRVKILTVNIGWYGLRVVTEVMISLKRLFTPIGNTTVMVLRALSVSR
jgi:hypothetical protein